MFKASELVAFVLSMVGMPYWYGTCVYMCSTSVLNSKTRQYPTHYTSGRTSRYKDDIAKHKVCTDCIGLIKGFFWTNGGKGVIEYIRGGAAYTNKYGSNGCPDKGANSMLAWCKSKGCKNGKIATLPEVPGILLFSSGHVGVYVGNGYAVEARGFNYGVVKTKVTSRKWTEWAYLPNTLLQYDNVPVVDTPSVPVIEVVYKLGDRVLKRDTPMMVGEDVKEMQEALNKLGYDCGTADGKFGRNSENGVKAFQTASKLEADGVFGKKSFEALRAILTAQNEHEKPTEPVPETSVDVAPEQLYEVHGFIPDVSVYQSKIDMDKFCEGNDFAIFRARVNGKDDTKFAAWATELKKRGFPFAVYDYVRLRSEEDAVAQADAMYAACSPYNPKIYYLDTEQLADGVDYTAEKKYIKAYVNRLREHGVKVVGQYTGDYRWRTTYRDIESIFDTLWIANWGKNEGVYTGWTLKSAAYTDKIHLHQYTSNGYTKAAGAPGIEHRVDLNRLTGVKPLSWFTGRKYIERDYTKYIVTERDTLWGIAKKLLGAGKKYTKIMELNDMSSTIIHKGDVLKIPTNA